MTDYPSQYSEPVLTPSDPYETGGAHAATERPTPGGSGAPSAKDKASDAADAGKQAASEVAQTASEKAKDVVGETKTQARNILSETQGQLKDQASAQHQNLISNLRSLGDELGSMAKNSDQSGPATDLVGQAGSRAHSAASWLDEREPGQLVDELRNLARRRPGAFIAGSLVAGILAGRLTRGVVAVHKDDSSDDSSGVSTDVSPAYGQSGYAPSTAPTGQTSGYSAAGAYPSAYSAPAATGYEPGSEPLIGAGTDDPIAQFREERDASTGFSS